MMHLWHLFLTSILIIEMRRYLSKIVTAFINCKDLLKFCLNFPNFKGLTSVVADDSDIELTETTTIEFPQNPQPWSR